MTASQKTCPICKGLMSAKVADWSFYCQRCDYWGADLGYDIESRSDEIFGGQEQETISFLDAIRMRNFNILLDHIKNVSGDRPLTILDVGCATGFFLQVAAARGHRVIGLEPNPRMAAGAESKGLNVIEGYFPEALVPGEMFDLITFNDVFEHLPELSEILTAVSTRLKPGGVLVLNLPSSRGLLFKIAQIAHGFGVTGLWHRLWQTMFYTPHLHYFNKRSLDLLVTQHGLEACGAPIELSAVALNGLWARVSADRKASHIKRVFTYCAALGVYPLLSVSPKDAFAAFYRPVPWERESGL